MGKWDILHKISFFCVSEKKFIEIVLMGGLKYPFKICIFHETLNAS